MMHNVSNLFSHTKPASCLGNAIMYFLPNYNSVETINAPIFHNTLC